MKTTNNFNAPSLVGIDELRPQSDGSATNIENFTVDPSTGAWDNRLGYEKFFASSAAYLPFTNQERIESLYVWNTHNSAKTYHLFEAARTGSTTSTLYYTVGNGPTGPTLETVRLGRTVPTNSEPATSFAPFGRFLIITNGHDQPAKFDGERLTPLGWQSIPGPVTPWRVDTDDGGIGNEQNITIGAPAGQTTNYLPEGFVQNIGLGSTTNDAKNAYKWKVSWVNETGSESPLSPGSELVTWVTPSGGTAFYRNRRNGVYLSDVPVGPSGTVARRLYRTMNLGDGATTDGNETYFFVAQINNNLETVYVDYTPDQFLVNLAPEATQSILFPAVSTRFSATFKGVLFIDGGQANSTRIFYSNPLSPDSFSSSSYFEVGVREGGDITGLFPYYNQLLVFRENSIEMIRGDSVNGFQITPFLSGVGTRAASTATTIPGIGVLFLGNDGIYRINGGLDGGSTIKVSKVSDDLVKTIKRINKSTVARATAAYSPKWREWHCYVPVDGEEKPSLGIVYHMDKDAWSLRTGFPVGCIATDQNGELIFGHNTGYIAGGGTYEAGLFVITRKRAAGYVVTGGDTYTDAAPPTAIYKSKWHDMKSAPTKKFVKYVYLHVVTKGDNTIPITYYMDFDYNGTTSSGEKMQRPDHADQGVYDLAAFDTSVWEEGMISTIRYPVAQKGSSYFGFKVETTNDIVLVGYTIEFSVDGTSTIRGKR